jgi:hypothetical protein
MNEPDRLFLIDQLQKSRAPLIEATAGVSDAQAASQPAGGRWSILDCVEHVALAERSLLARIRDAVPAETARPSDREPRILANGANRSRRVVAPEGARPSGRFGSLQEALGAFQDARDRTLQFVETCATDLRACTAEHPILGRVTGYECMLMVIMHPIRHADQIREIRTAPVEPGA